VPVLPGGARDRGALLSDPLPLVFVSVGTDYHPFDRLSRWIDAWLERGGSGSARCFVQTGTSAVPRLAEHRQYLGHAEMEAMMRQAAVVVCHGGPGTIMLASTLGKRPIVVPRRKRYGEHVDDHQCSFTERIAAEGAIVLAGSEEELGSCLDAALGRDAEATLPPNGAGPARAVAMFEQLVDDLVLHVNGSSKGKGVMRSAPVSRRRA
jgi:UDP-N-acetylglucosamine transferase subunit ALG13